MNVSKVDDYTGVRTKVYKHGIDLLAQATKKVLDRGLTAKDLPPQGPGRYFKVIEADKMEVVIRKVSEGLYKYQG